MAGKGQRSSNDDKEWGRLGGGGRGAGGEGGFSGGKKRGNLPVSRAKEGGIPKKL